MDWFGLSADAVLLWAVVVPIAAYFAAILLDDGDL
jgi:hypothetical protein